MGVEIVAGKGGKMARIHKPSKEDCPRQALQRPSLDGSSLIFHEARGVEGPMRLVRISLPDPRSNQGVGQCTKDASMLNAYTP
jgi:hypothetical protein